MKTLSILLSTAALAFGLVACGEQADTEPIEESPAAETAAETAAADGEYPLDTCVVSGEKLGSMGEPIVVEHEGTTVKLCCKECIEEFESDPDKYTAMVKEAG
ncbi:MAG: hypothetical protein WD342_00135 [Verrucomicrobiales bacterium]